MNTYKRNLILRGDILYAELGMAALTSNIRKNILPTHVHVGRESGVRPSLVLLEQLRTVDKCRLGDKIGHVSKSVMHQIDAAAAISLGLRSLQKDEV